MCDDIIRIQSLSIDLIMGLYAFERHVKQRITLGLSLHYRRGTGLPHERLNYQNITQRILMQSTQQSYGFLEDYAEELCNMLFISFPPITYLELTVSKNQALTEALASLHITRTSPR